MTKRVYTAKEIKEMREILDDAYPTYVNGFGMSMGPGEDGIERKLQTYMQQGISPKELRESLRGDLDD